MITFASVAVGAAYGPEYVFPLEDGIRRFTHSGYRFLLFTDRPELYQGRDNFETFDVSGFLQRYAPPDRAGWWGCMSIFDPTVPADCLIYTDVDNVIVGDLEPLIEDIRPYDFSAHREWGANWTEMAKGMLAFQVGGISARAIWERWTDPAARRRIGAASRGQDQAFIQLALQDAGITWHYVPDEWIASYKLLTRQSCYRSDVLARRPLRAREGTWEQAKILCMHGRPKARDVVRDRLPGWQHIVRAWGAQTFGPVG